MPFQTDQAAVNDGPLYLEDLFVGQRHQSRALPLDEADLLEFAGRYDPQFFHLDDRAAQRSLFRGLAASGWNVAAHTMRLIVESVPFAGGIIGAGGELDWPRPTRPGDRLRIESEILEIRQSRSRPERGMVIVRVTTLNQKDEPVQILTAKLVVPRREPLPAEAAPARKTGWLAAMSAMILALSACSSGPDYTAPPVALSPYVNQPGPSAEPPVGLDQWWDGFHDAKLGAIVTRAVAQNLDLAAARARAAEARAQAEAAGARLLPTGDLQSQIAPIHQSLETPIAAVAEKSPWFRRDLVSYDLGIGASWELDLAGGLHRQAEAAVALSQAAEALQAGTRVIIAAEAADAYLQIRGYQSRLAIAEQQLDKDLSLLALVRLRQANGVATDRETAQAEALAAQARASLPPLRQGLAGQTYRLDILLGQQPGAVRAELDSVSPVPTIPAIATGETSEMLRRRPDIIAAERQLAADNAWIGAAIADYYPKLSLGALLGFSSMDSSTLLTARAFQPQSAGGLRWRLFDFGRIDADVAAARGAHDESLALYRKTVLTAVADVENALVGMVQLAQEEDELDREAQSLIKARDSAQEAYQGGAVSLIEVIDSDRQLLLAQDDLARAKTDTARSAVHAFRALGGGW